MKIYIVKFSTSDDYDEIVSYHETEEEAQNKCVILEKQNPGFGFYVDDVELQP
jgi:hypothetical protein